MRYYSFNEFTENDEHEVITVSEQEVHENYYPNWYRAMCKKFGQEYVDATYSFEDCLEDWVITNWAWEVKE